MRYVQVTVDHRPDAGQRSGRRYTFENPLGWTDEPTARGFAFEALAAGGFLKGLVRVGFPEAAGYSYWFERAGLVGYRLVTMQDQPEETRLAPTPEPCPERQPYTAARRF